MSSTPSLFYSSSKEIRELLSGRVRNSADLDNIDVYVDFLNKQNLPIILDIRWLSKFLGCTPEFLLSLVRSGPLAYRSYKIPKANGRGFRVINEPLPALKSIQRVILDEICSKFTIHDLCFSYALGKTIKKNAEVHLKSTYFYKFDLVNFFESISRNCVSNAFYELGYTDDVASALADLCMLEGVLPQGAPTSAMLSNVCLYNFDCYISEKLSSLGFKYSRYSDDITVSGDRFEGMVFYTIRESVNKFGYAINESKTKVFRPNSLKSVTGIQISKRLRALPKLRRSLRQEIYYITKHGIDVHSSRKNEDPVRCLSRVEGQLNYTLWVDPNDRELRLLKANLNLWKFSNGLG